MIVSAQAPHRLYVVGVVMGDEDMMHILEAQSIVMEVLLECPDSYSYVYQYRIRLSVKIVTVAATSTAKGYKSKHFICYFYCKVSKKDSYYKVFYYLCAQIKEINRIFKK